MICPRSLNSSHQANNNLGLQKPNCQGTEIGREDNTWPGRNSIPPGIGEKDRNEKVKTLRKEMYNSRGTERRICGKIIGKVLLLFVGLGALGNNPWPRGENPASLELLLLHPVDHVLLLALALPRVVGADDVDLGRRGTTLDHVHDVVGVGNVESGIRKILIREILGRRWREVLTWDWRSSSKGLVVSSPHSILS